MGNEFGNRTDAELASAIYKPPEGQEEGAPELEDKHAPELQQPLNGPAGDARLQAALYPERDRNLAQVNDSGEVEAVVRDIDGRILLRGFSHTTESLIGQNARSLAHADLSGLELPELPDANLREADARGAKLGNLKGADLRGLVVDEETDISGADFLFAKLDVETYERLKGCRGFAQAKNLGRPFRE